MKTPSRAVLALILTLPLTLAPGAEPDLAQINATARGLAGESSGGPWESTPEWKNYQEWIDARWNYIEKVRLNDMRTWAGGALGDLRTDCPTVYYPFSGPDVLYVDTVFPSSRYLLMGGLEPVGTLPDLAKLQSEGKLPAYLAQMKTALFTILAASFFKTKDMKTDFNNQLMDGLVPAMAVFLARERYEIHGIEYKTLDRTGTLQPRGEKSGSPAVQITYGDGRSLVYTQSDLGNDGVKANPGFVKLMQKTGPGVTYLKAASYLLYLDYFSDIRNAILDNSLGVVEDDSGVPFRYFKPSQWTVTPYGNYTGPIKLFAEDNQPDLAAFYAATPHSPLTFGSGYKFDASISSLLVAKKNVPTAKAAPGK
jgi:hypothetical protein